jgi:hypothetical protein
MNELAHIIERHTATPRRINGAQISSADLSNDANLAKLSASQTFTGNNNSFRNGTNSTNAFNVQNALGNRILTIDSSNAEVELGLASSRDAGTAAKAILPKSRLVRSTESPLSRSSRYSTTDDCRV